MNMSELIAAAAEPLDFGPVYAETDMSRFPVEPWSVATNLVFLGIIVHFAVKTRMDPRRHPLLVVSLPILLVGFVGGTVYHATRSANVWLIMDYLPIMILALAACVYFWRALLGGWLPTVLPTLGPVLVYRLALEFVPMPGMIAVSMGYTELAIDISLPVVLHCALLNRGNWIYPALGMLCFAVAIACRQADALFLPEPGNIWRQRLPMGTHFLWHLFGGASAFFLVEYVYRSEILRSQAGAADV